MDSIARLRNGNSDDLDGFYYKVISLMECVHNLDGNYDENEVLHVVKEIQDFTFNDFEVIEQLNIDIIDTE